MRQSRYSTFLCLIALSGAAIVLFLMIASCSRNRSEYLYNEVLSKCELSHSDSKDETLFRLLELEQSLKEDDPDTIKFQLISKIGALYYYDYKMEQAAPYLKKAVGVARRCGDAYLCRALWNVMLVTNDIDSLIPITEECITCAERSGNILIQTKAQTALSKLYSISGNQNKAKTIIKNLNSIPEIREHYRKEIMFAEIYHLFYNNEYDSATHLLHDLNCDSLSLDGKNAKYWLLYNIEKQNGNYLKALQFRDSLDNITAEIDSIAHSDKLIRAKQEFSNRIDKERRQRNTVILIGSFVVVLLVGFLLWELSRRKLMGKQLELTDQISKLNLRLSELTYDKSESDNIDNRDDIENDIIEKLKLNRELFYTLPEYSALKQLNLLQNVDTIDKSKAHDALTAVICRFADVCNNIRQFCPSMTSEDLLYCAAIFVGFSKEVASIAFGSSEDALRRRKSRIKQKLSPVLFNTIFGTKL